MIESPYKIKSILRQRPTGVTAASSCRLDAVLKFDGPESPFCVYSEQVAVRLAQTLHVPVADGVIAMTGDGHAFASIVIDSTGMSLPDMHESQNTAAAEKYPEQAAALTAFDILIGNHDRARNIKVVLKSPHIRLFRAFDHSHALLNVEATPEESLARLKAIDMIVEYHPFFGTLSKSLFETWLERFAAIDDCYIRECCIFGRPFRAVTEKLQEDLGHALVARKNGLLAIAKLASPQIFSKP